MDVRKTSIPVRVYGKPNFLIKTCTVLNGYCASYAAREAILILLTFLLHMCSGQIYVNFFGDFIGSFTVKNLPIVSSNGSRIYHHAKIIFSAGIT